MSSTIWYSYVQAHGVSNVRHKSDRWIAELHLIRIVFVKPHDKSNSLLSYLVVVIFFCIWSHYTAMPPHTPPPRRAVTTKNSLLQCSGCKVISLLSSESAMSVKAPHCASWLWFSGVIYHRQLSNLNKGLISGWTDWAPDYYKRRSTFCCFFLDAITFM